MKTLKKREKSKKKRIILVVAASMMQTGEVSTRSLVKSVGATGKIVSIDKKEISAGISSVEVASVLVEIGDTVTAGQELLYFDTADIEESLKSAKTNLNNAAKMNPIEALRYE